MVLFRRRCDVLPKERTIFIISDANNLVPKNFLRRPYHCFVLHATFLAHPRGFFRRICHICIPKSHICCNLNFSNCFQMRISRFMESNVKDGESKGDVRYGPGKESDDSVEFDIMNKDSDKKASDYGDVLGLTTEDINWMVFRIEQRAYEFYMQLGKCQEFGIQKGDYGSSATNRAGLRDGKHYARLDRKRIMHKPETRTNCEEKLSIYLDRGAFTWKVRKVILDHNHDLTPTCMVHLMPHFCDMLDAVKAHMKSMHRLPTSKILRYMTGIAGG
ncbi:hypothetical protein Ahy_B04g073003 [Arachis hypogaea]|uniref:FAR1 domain-containing protein n=1 Tax=Arachis hypogaea TaxID=3818 RepID=A0A444ZPB6_ARAHY|nr:hypothetical protein Ahy_B04g073003 [Arachis hypogaea]